MTVQDIAISKPDAVRIIKKLLNAPIAPGHYSHFINVGTDDILSSLDHNYFRGELADGLGCFKYLEGGYGSGKTQFINSLAQRAGEQDVVTALVTVGADCPFNSPVAIFRAVMQSLQPPVADGAVESEARGIEVLLDRWIERAIRNHGAQPGGDVPDNVQRQIETQLAGLWKGAPDQQMATALRALAQRLLKMQCGAEEAAIDGELVSWIRGDNARSTALKTLGLFEPARDDNAFRRLKTVIAFLRTRMGCKGFLIAFDEGTRTSSFRRGSAKQKQAVENLLSMINDNADGQFGGVMFLYAATPDFRSDVISKYQALQDRIGDKSFSAASPMVPLINLEDSNAPGFLQDIGAKLLGLFARAYAVEWDVALQNDNMNVLLEAQEAKLFERPKPRYFVYQYCRFLEAQRERQVAFTREAAANFVENNEPLGDDEA